MNHIDFLQTTTAGRPYTFDRVEVAPQSGGQFCIIGKCYSEFRCGPNLAELAEAAGELAGRDYYGLKSCRYLGWRR